MNRSCLLCIGSYSSLSELVSKRIHSGEKDYMKYAFVIPIKDPISVSAEKLTPEIKNDIPTGEILHPGYCGEECRELLLNNIRFKKDIKDLYIIVGTEFPGCGYVTHDIVFPQGRCDKGENSRDASMREFFEEVGIKLDKSKTPVFLGFVGKKKEMSAYVYRVD